MFKEAGTDLIHAFVLSIILFLSFFTFGASAMSVTPLSVEMTASGTGNKSTIRVLNDSAAPIPVEIQVALATLNENGDSQSNPASDQFLIFPAQAVIPAGGSQSFRVQWRGDPNLAESKTFVFSVNQLPVNLSASNSGVQIVFNFSVIVNVAPLKGQSAIKLVAANIASDAKGVKRAVITVSNAGNRHALLGDGTIVLSSGAWTKTLTGGELRQMIGFGLVQPGKTRRFNLNVEIPPQLAKIDARVQYASTN